MTGKHGNRINDMARWLAAILLSFAPASLFAQAPQLSFSEVPPTYEAPPVTHSTQCMFPTASPLTPRDPETVTSFASPTPARTGATAIPTAIDTSGGLQQAGCASCGSCLAGPSGGCPSCAHAGRLPCYPGRKPYCGADGCDECPPPEPSTCLGRFVHGVWECICCQDPCYEGKWTPIADSAFFASAPRPITQTRLRWNSGIDVKLPDRSEFFWARADGGAGAKGPAPAAGSKVIQNFNYNDLMYTFEAAAGIMSIFTDVPYRSLDLPEGSGHYAGFGDIRVGIKSLIFDCELLQVATQMLTYTPSGIPSKGLGTGHVSLEPSLLVGIRLGKDTYLQHQFSEWIPLGGDPQYAGAVLHTHTSLNQVLFRFRPDVQLIGTCELNTWFFQDGAYTDPLFGAYQGSSGTMYTSMGPGLRLFVCDRIDFGFAASYALCSPMFWTQFYTTEFRWRF